MAAGASPLLRFRRAVERRSLLQAEAAARELDCLNLEDALRFVLLLRQQGDRRYERAAVRFCGRVLAERRAVGFELAEALLGGFVDLDGIAPEVARSGLSLALEGAGVEHAARYVASSEDVPPDERRR